MKISHAMMIAMSQEKVSWHQKILSLLALWRRNYRSRYQLRELPDHLLDDIGLDAVTQRKEADKPFWR